MIRQHESALNRRSMIKGAAASGVAIAATAYLRRRCMPPGR